ncbi:MAG: alpha/beta fold hydrolase [candidate division NC10 bacterium]|nr:alpha/beta fold hydrolase [candidate division NC10 bacterium]
MDIVGREHWTAKGEARLFLWEKVDEEQEAAAVAAGRVLLCSHGSSMAGIPTFDLQVPGETDTSLMDVFARWGYDVWLVDHEGYGRSSKDRPDFYGVDVGAEDLTAAAAYIRKTRRVEALLLYGISSGALRAGLFTMHQPECVRRLAMTSPVWKGEGSPTLIKRRERLPEFLATYRRPISVEFIRSVFERDHPGVADPRLVEAYAREVLKYDDSVPTGTYIDMVSRLPILDPARISVPTLLIHGEYDGVARTEDLLPFFAALPNPDRQYVILPGAAHHNILEKNRGLLFHALHAFFSSPAAVYRA